MPNYRCSACHQRTTPILCSVGVSGDCCPEAQLAVPDEEREPLFAADLSITILQAWQRGMSYDTMHDYFVAPADQCGCAACDRGREWDRAAARLDDECPTWDCPPLRLITAFEEDELKRDLFDDLPRASQKAIARGDAL